MRVVFNASAKRTSGTSLSQRLMVFPILQPIDILVRFRFHGVALLADVAKIYHQEGVAPVDEDYQSLL